MWRHTRRGDRYVTVIIDLTPARDRSGPARLLDVIPGRSRKVLTTWPTARGQSWRERVEVVATGLECSVFLGPWFLVVSGCVFAASQLVFDLVGGAVAER